MATPSLATSTLSSLVAVSPQRSQSELYKTWARSSSSSFQNPREHLFWFTCLSLWSLPTIWASLFPSAFLVHKLWLYCLCIVEQSSPNSALPQALCRCCPSSWHVCPQISVWWLLLVHPDVSTLERLPWLSQLQDSTHIDITHVFHSTYHKINLCCSQILKNLAPTPIKM